MIPASEDIFYDEQSPSIETIPEHLINLMQELSDGSAIYSFNGVEGGAEEHDSTAQSDPAFSDNLAENEAGTGALADNLLQSIASDKQSRSEWENTFTTGLRYLGIKLEEFRSTPFAEACGAFDSTLLSALVGYYCVARAELLPSKGPVSTEVVGMPTPETEDEAERISAFMNFYLTKIDKDYYPDFERLLLYTGACGSGFRKVYQDPILQRPLARFINPLDIIVDINTTSLLSSSRVTEVQYLTRREVLLKQESGYFIKFDLPINADENSQQLSAKATIDNLDGIKKSENAENKTLFTFYEVHADLTVEEVEARTGMGSSVDKTSLPRPYIVTICEATRKVVSIRRNWKEGDETYSRLQYYVNYYYLPGFGLYGIGLIHLLGSNAITMTSILRQTIDAGALKNLPAAVMQSGMRMEKNDFPFGPGEIREVQTNGTPLSECFQPLPFSEPSATLIALRKQVQEETERVVMSAANQIPDVGSNAPVGTTLARLEVANRMQSTVLRSLRVSLGTELQLLYNLFGEYLSDEPYPFNVPGKEMAIMKRDFSDRVHVTPVSDPNMLTSTHRLLRSEAELRLAQSAPELHDMREFYVRVYKSMGIDMADIDKLIPPTPAPMSLDVVSENALMLAGKPVVVATFQDDDEHIAAHMPFVSQMLQQGNIQVYTEAALHVQAHKAVSAWKDLQRQTLMPAYQEQMQARLMEGVPQEVVNEEIMNALKNIPFPPLDVEALQEVMASPEVQNMVTSRDAAEAMQQAQQQQEEAAEQIDPNKVMIADIEQRREAAHLKADGDKLKVEGEAFKAQLKHEAEMTKTESQVAIAADKHEIDIAIAQSKNLM